MAEVFEVISYSKRNRRKPFKWFLEYLKHAEDCQRSEIKDPIIDAYKIKMCNSELCNYVDLVITHQMLMSCKGSKSCSINACYSSFKTLLHCKECTESDCLVCVPVKGEKKPIVWGNEKIFGVLDTSCGIYFDERKIGTGTCAETRTVETQTDEFISENSSTKDVDESESSEFQTDDEEEDRISDTVYLPGGLVLQKVKRKLRTLNGESGDFLLLRVNQIIGCIRTIVRKDDIFTLLDKKLLYFFMYITCIEKEIHDTTNSKEEYMKKVVACMCETSKSFQEYQLKQKYPTVQDAAHFYFKSKITEKFGSNKLKEITFPLGGVMLKLRKPRHKVKQQWQESITALDREETIIKKAFLRKVIGEAKERLNEMQILIFHPYTIDAIGIFCRKEATIFEVANSKSDYYDRLQALISTKSEEEDLAAKQENKKYVENLKNVVKGFPRNKLNEILNNYKTRENTNDQKVTSAPSVFCYSHFLLLIYSVTYQLWKKSEKEKEVEEKN